MSIEQSIGFIKSLFGQSSYEYIDDHTFSVQTNKNNKIICYHDEAKNIIQRSNTNQKLFWKFSSCYASHGNQIGFRWTGGPGNYRVPIDTSDNVFSYDTMFTANVITVENLSTISYLNVLLERKWRDLMIYKLCGCLFYKDIVMVIMGNIFLSE